MTREHDIERVLDVWFTDGPTQMPDRFYSDVVRAVDRQPQRRLARLPLRSLDMTVPRFAALGAAAILILAVLALAVGAGRSPGPTPAPSPSATPVPSAASLPATGGPITPGRYAWAWPGGRLTFTLPAGWSSRADGQISKHENSPTEVVLLPTLPGTPAEVTHVFGDSCHPSGTLKAIGPSVDDLLAALDAQTATDATVSDLVIGGHPGHRVDMRLSSSVEPATCEWSPDGPITIWADPGGTSFFAFPFDHPGAAAYVVDVDGVRVVFIGGAAAEVSAADQAELDGVIASMAFEKTLPG